MKTRNLIRPTKTIFVFFLPTILFFGGASILIAQQHGDLVRIQGEEKIYLIQSGQRRAIASEEVFRKMGFKMEDVKELDPQTVMNIPEGPPLWSKETIAPYPDGTLVRLKGKAQTYVIRAGRKCYIPDPETFQAYGFQWDQVIEVEQSPFNKIPTGIPLPSVKPPTMYGAPGMPPPAIGPPGMPTSPYPSQPYPPSAYPPQTYPPSTYPPSTTPPAQPYQYPPPPGSQAPSYPPPTYPSQPSPYPQPSNPQTPSYPPSPTYPPSTSPPSPPSSRLPLVDRSLVTASVANFIMHRETNWNSSDKPDLGEYCLRGAKRRLI